MEGELSFVYAYIGALDRVMDYPERGVAIGFWGQSTFESTWYPPFAPVRKTERFKAFVRKAGLVDYWRAQGLAGFVPPHRRRRFRLRLGNTHAKTPDPFGSGVFRVHFVRI